MTSTINSLHEFLVKVTSHTVLWLDRETTAPIAFYEKRCVHAVLFVDLHYQNQILQQLMLQEDQHDTTDNNENENNEKKNQGLDLQ
jgi:3-isopropylmalate dehydratase small subunit